MHYTFLIVFCIYSALLWLAIAMSIKRVRCKVFGHKPINFPGKSKCQRCGIEKDWDCGWDRWSHY